MSSHGRIPPWVWAPLILALDFVSKRIVLAHQDELMRRIELIGDWVRLAYVRNSGAAMGLKLGGRYFLIGVSVLASIFLISLYRRTPAEYAVRRGAMAAIAGGALGNLVDRIFYDGRVVDFIDLGVGTHRFWTFNIADMGVTLGGLLLFVALWRHQEPREDDGLPAATSTPGEPHPVPGPEHE